MRTGDEAMGGTVGTGGTMPGMPQQRPHRWLALAGLRRYRQAAGRNTTQAFRTPDHLKVPGPVQERRPYSTRLFPKEKGDGMHRRSVLVGGATLGTFIATGSKANAMNHVAMLGDSVFDNGSYIGGAPDVGAQAQALLSGVTVSSVAQDGAVIADIESQVRRIPEAATHIVVSIGGNDALRASGVIDESAPSVTAALDRLGLIREQFSRSYASMVQMLLDRGVPLAVCSIYEPRFPDLARRRAAANALTLLNDVITRQAFGSGASLIDLRLICDRDDDFANPIEPSAAGGAKIARAIARFASGDRATSVVFA